MGDSSYCCVDSLAGERMGAGDKALKGMARPGRLELPTLCLEGRRSIQLSYGRTVKTNQYLC